MKSLLSFIFFFSCFVVNARQEDHSLLTRWMDLHCNMVRSARGISHVAYSRHFAYTAIAVYESIAGSNKKYNSLSGHLNGLQIAHSTPSKIIWSASLNAAYAAMLRAFYGNFDNCSTTIDSMETAEKNKIKIEKKDKSILLESIEFGKSTANNILEWAKNDLSENNNEYVAIEEEGKWFPGKAKAASPFWSSNRSIIKDLSDVYHLQQPVYNRNTTSDFFKEALEVYEVSKKLTDEQKATALYWDDAPNGKYKTVFGHWTSILSGLIKQHNLQLMQAAESFALMSIAMHDAAILTWKNKYHYKVLRPINYIQNNIDSNWQSLIGTPPHPEFPAAHAALSNAAAVALCSIFGEQCRVTDDSYVDIGMPKRSYVSIQHAAKEAGMSRLYGGIHFRNSIEQGLELGAATAKHVIQSLPFKISTNNNRPSSPAKTF